MKKIILTIFAALILPSFARETLRIGIEGAYPPFSEVNAQGELAGFDVDISRALCEAMAADCELVQVDWDGLIPALKAKKIDAIIASMSATDERKKSVSFSEKYYSTVGKIVAPVVMAEEITDGNLQEMLKDKVMGVQRGTIHDSFVTAELSDTLGEIRRYNTQDEANLDLRAGRIDVTLADQIALINGFLDTPEGEGYAFAEPKFDDPKYYGEGVAIAVRLGDETLAERFNAAILKIRENGKYLEINDRYFPIDIY